MTGRPYKIALDRDGFDPLTDHLLKEIGLVIQHGTQAPKRILLTMTPIEAEARPLLGAAGTAP